MAPHPAPRITPTGSILGTPRYLRLYLDLGLRTAMGCRALQH